MPFSMMTGMLVGRDREELRSRAAALAARRDPTELRPWEPQGRRDTEADAWLSRPPDGWIVGTVDEAIEQLREVRDAGVSRVMLQHLLHTDLDVVSLIGRELAPAVA
jgi:alkanesulfonate monooxygenase SsuD/methylene tetrahydromethanopterin reductase-like flavin-dependent oxidoreductase (luciferase family)